MVNKFWLFSVLLFLTSCFNSEEVFMESVDNQWKKNEAKKIEFEVKDAQNPKNIIFVVRNNNDYPYQNLFLITTLKGTQNEVLRKDTANYILAKPNGEWIGEGFGDTKEILFQYQLGYQFPKNGRYSVEIIQGMRKDILPGIEDIGIKLENIKK